MYFSEFQILIKLGLVGLEGLLNLPLLNAEGLADFGEKILLHQLINMVNGKSAILEIFLLDWKIHFRLCVVYCFQDLVGLELPIKHALSLHYNDLLCDYGPYCFICSSIMGHSLRSPESGMILKMFSDAMSCCIVQCDFFSGFEAESRMPHHSVEM